MAILDFIANKSYFTSQLTAIRNGAEAGLFSLFDWAFSEVSLWETFCFTFVHHRKGIYARISSI